MLFINSIIMKLNPILELGDVIESYEKREVKKTESKR
jgi:hypothetical protein